MSDPGRVAALTALVVASRGGPSLRQTLDSVAWAGRRCVLDPAGVLGCAAPLPGVEAWTPAAASGWVLLLGEGEVVTGAAATAIAAAAGGPPLAYRLPLACEAFGSVLRLAGRALRLAHGAAAGVQPRLGGEITLAATTEVRSLAGATIVRRLPPLPRDAVDELNADADALAALAAAEGVRPRALRLPLGGAIGGARVLLGRASAPLGWGRWIAAGLAGYRALLAEAKLWERAQLGTPVAR